MLTIKPQCDIVKMDSLIIKVFVTFLKAATIRELTKSRKVYKEGEIRC